jgi:hypothetical protein
MNIATGKVPTYRFLSPRIFVIAGLYKRSQILFFPRLESILLSLFELLTLFL